MQPLSTLATQLNPASANALTLSASVVMIAWLDRLRRQNAFNLDRQNAFNLDLLYESKIKATEETSGKARASSGGRGR